MWTRLEPHTEAFLNAMAAQGVPPLHELPPDEVRRVFDAIQVHPVTLRLACVRERTIASGWGDVRIHTVLPAPVSAPVPAIMYFHGGGWVAGNFRTHERLVRELAAETRAAVIFVEYDLAPEATWPTAAEQCYAALLHIAGGGETGIDGSRLAVAGDSAGGNLAAAVTMLSKHRNGPAIAFQVLFCPMLDGSCSSPSYAAFANGPMVTRAMMNSFWSAYVPDRHMRRHPMISPVEASVKRLADLPPALVVTSDHDVCRDEGETYADKLIQSGVPVTSIRYLGTVHDFMMINALAGSAPARNAVTTAGRELRDALDRNRELSLTG